MHDIFLTPLLPPQNLSPIRVSTFKYHIHSSLHNHESFRDWTKGVGGAPWTKIREQVVLFGIRFLDLLSINGFGAVAGLRIFRQQECGNYGNQTAFGRHDNFV